MVIPMLYIAVTSPVLTLVNGQWQYRTDRYGRIVRSTKRYRLDRLTPAKAARIFNEYEGRPHTTIEYKDVYNRSNCM